MNIMYSKYYFCSELEKDLSLTTSFFQIMESIHPSKFSNLTELWYNVRIINLYNLNRIKSIKKRYDEISLKPINIHKWITLKELSLRVGLNQQSLLQYAQRGKNIGVDKIQKRAGVFICLPTEFNKYFNKGKFLMAVKNKNESDIKIGDLYYKLL